MSPFLGSSVKGNYPQIPVDELEGLVSRFKELDVDGDGKIDAGELIKLCRKSGLTCNFDDIVKACREVSKNEDVSLDNYLSVVSKLKGPVTPVGKFTSMKSTNNNVTDNNNNLSSVQSSPEMHGGGSSTGKKQITRIAGATGSSQHSIDDEELEQFVLHINQILTHDTDIGHRVPIDAKSHQLFQECRDGLVLSKLINDSSPDTIDERVLNVSDKLNPFQMTENNNVVINSAKAIGCSVVNIGSQDLIEGREHLVLGLVWQIIKVGLLAKVNLHLHPELFRLLRTGEGLEDLLRMPADELLIRWFNYHLKQAGWHREVNNFSSDIRDSENYTVLLNQLAPGECNKRALEEGDIVKRAELVLQNAGKIGCRKYVSVKAITEGNPKLNLAFVANLFNQYPGLAPLTEEELASLDEGLFASQGDREARAFALWMNSLGVDPFVNSIYDDLRDGRVLLQVFDKVRPGSVVWRRANQKAPLIRFKCIENTNYVVELGKQWNFSLVGIQGADITDASKTLTLALVWQLMKENIIETLKKLGNDHGRTITDSDIINWANELVQASGKESSMTSFKDSTLSTGRFLIDLVNGMKKNVVNYELVTEGDNEDDAKMNAKYAISIARKLGATIFLLPEDIVEVKPKMILTFVGTLMAVHKTL